MYAGLGHRRGGVCVARGEGPLLRAVRVDGEEGTGRPSIDGPVRSQGRRKEYPVHSVTKAHFCVPSGRKA